MVVLKAYLDDSGSADDPTHSCITIAGYVSTVDGWDWFEHHWPRVLRRYNVPYLHMKELWNREGIYKEMKETAGAETDFLAECIQTIQIATEFHVSATVRLADLCEFNKETRLKLEPSALALYGCLIELRSKYPDSGIEIFIDNITKPYLTIDKGRVYARLDTHTDLKVDSLMIASIGEGNSFKNILPIQAADFTAYEIRKHCEEHKTFKPTEESRVLGEQLNTSYLEWEIDFIRKNNRNPRNRMSARMLSAWPPAKGYIWDKALIMGAHINRHKNGWS
jgi:hypothetical protein